MAAHCLGSFGCLLFLYMPVRVSVTLSPYCSLVSFVIARGMVTRFLRSTSAVNGRL